MVGPRTERKEGELGGVYPWSWSAPASARGKLLEPGSYQARSRESLSWLGGAETAPWALGCELPGCEREDAAAVPGGVASFHGSPKTLVCFFLYLFL